MKLTHVSKIDVLRANGIGDLVFIMPALQALRVTYPRAEIVLLAKLWHAEFFQDRPGPIDRVVVIPPYAGVSEEEGAEQDTEELARFFSAMQKEQFDLAVQLHGGGCYSNPFVQQLAARLTIGLKTDDAAPLDLSVPYVYFQPEIMRALEVVALVDARPESLAPRIAVTARDRAEAERVLPSVDEPLVALNPGATDLRRRWPAENFAAVGDVLARAGARVVVTGSQSDQPLGAAVTGAMKAEGIDLCGKLSLGGLAGMLSRCQVVISNDTGPLHLAGAVGTATVGIYWCGNLLNADPLTRTHHRPLVSWQLDCPVCGRNTIDDHCEHNPSFVSSVPVEHVVKATLDLFASR